MIMMPYNQPWPSLQLTGHADFWHPTGRMTFFSAPHRADPRIRTGRMMITRPGLAPQVRGHDEIMEPYRRRYG